MLGVTSATRPGGQLVVAGEDGTFCGSIAPEFGGDGRRIPFHRRVDVRFGNGEAPHVRASLATLAMIAHGMVTPADAEAAALLSIEDGGEGWRRSVLSLV